MCLAFLFLLASRTAGTCSGRMADGVVGVDWSPVSKHTIQVSLNWFFMQINSSPNRKTDDNEVCLHILSTAESPVLASSISAKIPVKLKPSWTRRVAMSTCKSKTVLFCKWIQTINEIWKWKGSFIGLTSSENPKAMSCRVTKRQVVRQ